MNPLTGPEQFNLDGKVALITGAGGDFGRCIAMGLARSGATVCLTDIDNADGTVESLANQGEPAQFWRADVRNPSDIAIVFDSLDAQFGGIDILVNNAGINPRQGTPETYSLDVWNDVISTNLTGYLLFAQHAGRLMIRNGTPGSMINVSSIAGATALGRGNLGFGVSKAGVEQLTRSLAVAWACHGIRVNAIQPCQFLSAGMRNWLADPASADVAARMLAGIPMSRMGEPEEIVGTVLYLASSASAMVTGTVIPIDGGNLALNPGGTIGQR